MPVPSPIGVVHFSEPRAVQVRSPENLSDIHSAVQASVVIYTDSKKETDLLLLHWEEIMAAANEKAKEIIGLQ